MKPNGNKTWLCIKCKKRVQHLHEIFAGRFRQTSIKYNIQVPVCICIHPHDVHHAAKSKKWARWFCCQMGIDYDKVLLALNTNDKKYLEDIKEWMELKLKQLEV